MRKIIFLSQELSQYLRAVVNIPIFQIFIFLSLDRIICKQLLPSVMHILSSQRGVLQLRGGFSLARVSEGPRKVAVQTM